MSASSSIRVLLGVCLGLWLAISAAAQEESPLTLSGTQWQFVASTTDFTETLALPDETITLAFDETSITGSSGCNTYNGSYTLSGVVEISVGPLASTRMACVSDELNQQEQFYLEVLQKAYKVTREGNVLTIDGNRGRTLTFLRILPLQEGVWELTSYGPRGAETPVIDGTLIAIAFAQDGSASGTAGCNSFGSGYTHDAATATLTFDSIFTTEMACMGEGVMEQESAFVAALGKATTYEIQANHLTITTQDDQVLHFTRGPLLEDTRWLLVMYGDVSAPTPALEDHPVTLTLVKAKGEAGGRSTCNYYGGPYTLDEQTSTIAFKDVFTTLMGCAQEVLEAENAYMEAFGAVTHYTLSGDTLTLFYGEGDEQALVYRPAYQTAPMTDKDQ